MDLDAKVQAANEVLASMRDKDARWWRYSVSHRTFELVVGDPEGNGNIVLCLSVCDYIAGPVQWPSQRLQVILDHDRSLKTGSGVFVLQDEMVGFKVQAMTFLWQKDFNLLKHHSLYFREEGELGSDSN